MNRFGPFGPSQNEQAVMAEFFVQYPTLAPGMCYLFGMFRQAGFTRSQATAEVYRSVGRGQATRDQEAGEPYVTC
jgi:hypothetical protein